MNNITKKFIDIFVIVSLGLTFSSCSMYNHNRIKDKMAMNYLAQYGNETQIQYVTAGIRPSNVMKIQVIKGDHENEIQTAVAFNLLNTKGISSYLQTFKEEPISSTWSLFVDAAITYTIKEGIDKLNENNNSKEESLPIINNTYYYYNSNNNVTESPNTEFGIAK